MIGPRLISGNRYKFMILMLPTEKNSELLVAELNMWAFQLLPSTARDKPKRADGLGVVSWAPDPSGEVHTLGLDQLGHGESKEVHCLQPTWRCSRYGYG